MEPTTLSSGLTRFFPPSGWRCRLLMARRAWPAIAWSLAALGCAVLYSGAPERGARANPARVTAPAAGRVERVLVAPGETVSAGQPVALLVPFPDPAGTR